MKLLQIIERIIVVKAREEADEAVKPLYSLIAGFSVDKNNDFFNNQKMAFINSLHSILEDRAIERMNRNIAEAMLLDADPEGDEASPKNINIRFDGKIDPEAVKGAIESAFSDLMGEDVSATAENLPAEKIAFYYPDNQRDPKNEFIIVDEEPGLDDTLSCDLEKE